MYSPEAERIAVFLASRGSDFITGAEGPVDFATDPTTGDIHYVALYSGKLYLEFGGKLLFDYHAARVLPGFNPNVKMQLLHKLKDQSEVILCIFAGDIEKKKMRADFGITYDTDALKTIDELGLDDRFGVTVTRMTRADIEMTALPELRLPSGSSRALRIVAGATSGGAALVVRTDSGIQRPEDFHGKKIASPQMGNTQDVAARAWLQSKGLKKGSRVAIMMPNVPQYPVAIAGVKCWPSKTRTRRTCAAARRWATR